MEVLYLRVLNGKVKDSVNSDWNATLESYALSINDNDDLHQSKQVYQIMRKLQKRSYKCPVIMIDGEGNVLRDPIEVRKQFLRRMVAYTCPNFISSSIVSIV